MLHVCSHVEERERGERDGREGHSFAARVGSVACVVVPLVIHSTSTVLFLLCFALIDAAGSALSRSPERAGALALALL